ncbi:hypothetical protein [Sorangium sp. So ce341]|uniref:hypothetical protein n=1 Tax=Sorangium sp. So ce341 TaxID=3133302 RepID=UPI003F6012F0
MIDEADLPALLPSRNLGRLAQALGRRLLEIERIFTLSPESFADGGLRDVRTYFRRCSGPTRFLFEGGVEHAYGEWGSQLSVVLLPEPPEPDEDQRAWRLGGAGDPLSACLGGACADVRIWILDDGLATDEAKECSISYLLEGGAEVFYCTWLHGDLDTDYLLPGDEVPRERVARCLSVARGGPVPLAEVTRA